MKLMLRKTSLFLLLSLLPILAFSQTNQYLHFDKVDDFCQLTNASQYVANAPGISLTGWFYCDALAYGQGMMGLRSGSQGFYMIILNNGQIECRLRSSTALYTYNAPANSVVPQMWQHFAWIFNGTNCTLYVNGILKGSVAAAGSFTETNVPFGIGKSLLGGYNFVYGGRIDEVSVWNKALTQAEVQDMITNELTGTEANLQLYYKFNQGVPGGNNTSINKLHCEIGNGTRDADLLNFALTGATSNFNGTLVSGFQAISFPQIPSKLTTTPPFVINASASSGLPVSFQVVSGPATINGDTLTLTGAGQVAVKATQVGDTIFDTASPVVNTFNVYDPILHVPDIDIRNPIAGNVSIPTLKAIQLSALVSITVPELFSVTNVTFSINGTTIPALNHGNNHYTAWWNPTAYGSYTMLVTATNNYGASGTANVSFAVTQDTAYTEAIAFEGIWLNTDIPSQVAIGTLPSYVGAYNKIIGTLQVSCPAPNCGEWDRVASVDAQGHDGVWHEIIRYITPYGVPCSHNIDLTDYMSLLSGRISFRVNCGTLDNGYVYKLTLKYSAGIPAHCYSDVNTIWWQNYNFGDYANLQPVPIQNFTFPWGTVEAKLKLASTGHGWGDLNTSNAAEFYEATHHVWVNNVETFEQHNWVNCNPNPDGCQPQNGTYYYNRAGWCPGSIAPWFTYNMTPYISSNPIELKYVFFPGYLDLCHPNNPNCVTGVTCTNCADGFNPFLDVACNLVVFSDGPISVAVDKNDEVNANFRLYPNPSTGLVNISTDKPEIYNASTLILLTPSGQEIQKMKWNGEMKSIDLSDQAKGIYFLKIQLKGGVGMKKFILM